jgi:flagellar basal body-associated protein FliL
MAEQDQQANNKASKTFSPLMTLLILAAVLCMQVGVVGAAYWMWGGAKPVKADAAAADKAAKAEQPVEIMIVEDKFQNTRTGRSYLYDTEVYIVAKQKHKDFIKKRMKARKAQIVTEIATIIRRAEPSYFDEPELSTLTRQIRAALNRVLGKTEGGKSYIDQVLIKKMTEFRTDM